METLTLVGIGKEKYNERAIASGFKPILIDYNNSTRYYQIVKGKRYPDFQELYDKEIFPNRDLLNFLTVPRFLKISTAKKFLRKYDLTFIDIILRQAKRRGALDVEYMRPLSYGNSAVSTYYYRRNNGFVACGRIYVSRDFAHGHKIAPPSNGFYIQGVI